MAGREAGPFNPRVVAGLIAAGILAFGAFMVLAAYAGNLRSGRDGRAHALSVAATGYKGLVDLVGYSGGKASLIRSEAELDTEDLVVVALDEQAEPHAVPAILAMRMAKPTLLILPKWETQPDSARASWVRALGLRDESAVASQIGGISDVAVVQGKGAAAAHAYGTHLLEGLNVAVPRPFQSVSGAGVRPLLSAPGGGALIAQLGKQPHYLVADPDLMNNHGLKNPRTARAALSILSELNSTGAETVAFDLTLNGFAAKQNALKLAFEPPFLALTLALVVAALLAGLHGAFQFGPEAREERAIAFGKAALVENVAGLIRLARREHRLGGAYAEAVGEQAARASGAPPALRGDELAAYLDRLTDPERPRYSDLAAQARAASNPAEIVSAARALFLWNKELMQ